ncbi:MAG: beta clamp protein [Podoviridae sp. ctbh1]|nr:MAG: beta clamp protein [Podoviridae sp. ctbh1]
MEFIKQVTVKYSHLQAALPFAAKQDVRFYLTGVLVKDGMVAATNGHCALICNSDDVSDMEIIIPRIAIESLIKKLGKNPMHDVITISQIDKEFWVMDYKNDVFEMFKPIDGRFPDIGRVDISKPSEAPNQFIHWNLDYLHIFMKCAKTLKVLYPKFFPTAHDKATYVELNEEVHGILMPIREL